MKISKEKDVHIFDGQGDLVFTKCNTAIDIQLGSVNALVKNWRVVSTVGNTISNRLRNCIFLLNWMKGDWDLNKVIPIKKWSYAAKTSLLRSIHK